MAGKQLFKVSTVFKIVLLLAKRSFLCYFAITYLFSCAEATTPEPGLPLRDSIMKIYREEATRDKKIDTSDFNYKLLNAYANNDTSALRVLLEKIDSEKERRQWWSRADSCINLPELRDLDPDEAYRFAFDGAMCPYRQITTIYKRHDSIKLNFELFEMNFAGIDCKKIEAFEREVTSNDWEKLLDELKRGDFWGLKSDNKVHGLDGSTMYVTGFKKSGDKEIPSSYHFVQRWGPTSLREAFELATLLAANRQGCFWIRTRK